MANKEAYTSIYLAIGGWQSQLIFWATDDETGEGYWDIWATGMGPFGSNKAAAIRDAKSWAESEGIRYDGPDEDDDPRVVTNADGSASFAPGVKLVGMGF